MPQTKPQTSASIAVTSGAAARAPGSGSGMSLPSARLLAFLSRLPLPFLYALARPIMLLALWAMAARRRIIRDNLAKAFPELSIEARDQVAKTFVHNYADVAGEIVKAYSIGRDALNARVRISNIEVLERFVQANQSILLVGSHEANWEWVFLSCSSQLPFDIQAVYRPMRSAGADAFMRAMRTRFGAALVTRQELGRELLEGRNKLRAIVLTVDERPAERDECHWVQFLNQDTAFRSRFEKLARFLRYPVVFVSRRRTSRGHYEVGFVILGEPPYDSQPGQLVERYAQALQRSINASPADWLWMHRRWDAKKSFYS